MKKSDIDELDLQDFNLFDFLDLIYCTLYLAREQLSSKQYKELLDTCKCYIQYFGD